MVTSPRGLTDPASNAAYINQVKIPGSGTAFLRDDYMGWGQDTNGYFYVACQSSIATGTTGILRLTRDGALDTTFGTGGFVADPLSANNYAFGVATMVNNIFYIATIRGQGSVTTTWDFYLLAYNTSGVQQYQTHITLPAAHNTLDPGPTSASYYFQIVNIAADTTNGYLVGSFLLGTGTGGPWKYVGVFRAILSTGALDTTFGPNSGYSLIYIGAIGITPGTNASFSLVTVNCFVAGEYLLSGGASSVQFNLCGAFMAKLNSTGGQVGGWGNLSNGISYVDSYNLYSYDFTTSSPQPQTCIYGKDGRLFRIGDGALLWVVFYSTGLPDTSVHANGIRVMSSPITAGLGSVSALVDQNGPASFGQYGTCCSVQLLLNQVCLY